MNSRFPYKLLNKEELRTSINNLSLNQTPFLFIIDYLANHGYIIKADELDEQFVKFKTSFSYSKFTTTNLKLTTWNTAPLTLDEYKLKFDYVQQQIQKGNSFLTNLTQPTAIQTNLSLSKLYDTGNAKYKLWFNNQFTVFSPETFIQINDGKIAAFPMKGTIEASILNARELILKDPKEQAEHATIVDLIRNDLSLVAENVEVKSYRFIEKINTNRCDLLQVSSEISGELPTDYQSKLGDILFALLPAGSICGAPKIKTLQIIEESEGYKRGFYTGVFGWFDGKCLDSAVMIRFIEQQNDKMIFKSGGGITSKSELEKEYQELIQKVYVPIY